MAHSADLKEIEKQVNKCFENLNRFILQDEIEHEDDKDHHGEKKVYEKGELNDIYGIKSVELEEVKLIGVLKTWGQGVEEWMSSLEMQMVLTVQKRIREAYSKYYEEGNPESDRNIWVFKHISQAVTVVDKITWTEGTEMALNDLLDDNPFAMEDHFLIMKQQIDQITELIRGNLTKIQRRTLVSLITQDVHSRDIVEALWTKQIMSPFDFIW